MDSRLRADKRGGERGWEDEKEVLGDGGLRVVENREGRSEGYRVAWVIVESGFYILGVQ